MKKIICKNKAEAGQIAADIFAEEIRRKPNLILGLATGSTPILLYSNLSKMVKEGKISFKDVITYNLDEYYPIKRDNPQSYYSFMFEHLFSKVDIDPANVHIPNGEASDPQAECQAYEASIRQAGGIDVQLLGIGRNGHVGFNEPDDFLYANTHITGLTESTVEANKVFFDKEEDMPKRAMTMGLYAILNAKKIVLIATGKEKIPAVKRLLEPKVGTDSPASFLHLHPDVTIILDMDAADI